MWLVAASLCAAAAGNPHLPRALAQLDALDEAAALQTLAQAKAWPQNTPAELARVHLYIGLAHAGLAHEAEAVAAFREALLLEPALQLPSTAPPRVRAWFSRAGGGAAPHRPPPAPQDAPLAQVRPALEPSLAPGAPKAVAAEPPAGVKPRRVVGIGLSIAAAGALVAAVVVGVQAGALHQKAQSDEPRIGAALALQAQAEQRAGISTALYASAGVALGGGLLLALVP